MADFRTPKARYIGYVKDTENHGDEALIWIIRDLLAPEVEVSVDAEDFDIALLGGGTLINQSPWLIDVFGDNLARARHGLVFGTGVGDPLFWGDTFSRWTPLLKRCIRVGVRGPHSAELLADHGFPNAEMTGDPYLALHTPMDWRPAPKRLAINFGTANGAIFGGDEEGFIDFISNLLASLRKDGWTFVWVSVWSRDLEIMRRVRDSTVPGSGPLFDARSQTLETLSAISGCTAFLGEKLHALAMAAVAGTPFLAWEYQPKVLDFCASLGMEDHIISTRERDIQSTKHRLDRLAADAPSVAEKLRLSTIARRAAVLDFASGIRRWASRMERK